MQLTPGISIDRGDPVTRQTIFDVVSTAVGGTVAESDLAADTMSVVAASSPPDSPLPGKLWFDLTDDLMKVFVDVVDGTACSCWLSVGPDRLDLAVYATEPIPFGAAVQLAGAGRAVQLPPGPLELFNLGHSAGRWETAKVIGFNCDNNNRAISCQTAASGTWFALGAEGLVWAWHPCNRDVGGSVYISSSGAPGLDTLISGTTGLTGPSGTSNVRGGIIFSTVGLIQNNAGSHLTVSPYRASAGQQHWLRQPFLGPRVCRDS